MTPQTLDQLRTPADQASDGERVAKSFKDYELEGWNSKASQYERLTLPITRQGFEPILTSFGDLSGRKLLDVCTGPGHLAGEAASRGALVDAIDFSEAMVREAKVRFKDTNFMEGDAEALPYDDLSFDAVACCFGLLHLPNAAQGVRESYRVLKPGGRYSVTLWSGPERPLAPMIFSSPPSRAGATPSSLRQTSASSPVYRG